MFLESYVNMLKTDRILFQGVHQIIFCTNIAFTIFFLVLSLRRLVCTSFYQVWGNLNNYIPLRNRKHVPWFYRVIQTRVEVWENEKCCGNTSRRRVFPQLFRVLPNFHECLYNSIETRSTCFLFLLEKHHDEKKENNLLTLIIKK